MQGSTALIYAAYNNHAKGVQILVDADADLNSKDKFVSACWQCRCGWYCVQGNAALSLAAGRGRTEAVQILVDANADVDSKTNDVSACWQ